MQQSELNQSLNIELEKIPSMPRALLQLLEVIRDPDARFTEVTEIIQSDPALTARVMSIVSTGSYYQWSQNKDFNRLLVAMGMKMVKNIAINSAVQQFFSQFNVDDEGMLAQFWQTSLTTASNAKALAHMIGYANEDEAYITGLLHNIGELVCLMHDSVGYAKQKTTQQNKTQTASIFELHAQQSKMEQAFIGASIPEIGYFIIHSFDKESLMGDSVLYQRESAEQILGAPHLVQIINLSSKLASLHDQVEQEDKQAVFKEVSYVFDLNQPLLEEMLVTSHDACLETAQKMGVSISDDNKIELNNEQIQIELADNVRTIALSSSLQQINAFRLDTRSENELIEQILQNLKMLFGLSQFVFLAYDEEKNQLSDQFRDLPESNAINIKEKSATQFNISLDADRVLPVQAMERCVPITSQDSLYLESGSHKKTVLDRQLLRAMNTEEMLCIPLQDKAKNKKYGVIVAGLSAIKLQKIKCEKGLLHEFSMAASDVISQDHLIAEQLQSVMNDQHSLQSLQIRKLVHEANNPLGVIRNYLQVLSLKLADSKDEKLQGQLEILMAEVERVGNIVLRIREVPQKPEMDSNKVDLNLIISQLLSIFQESLFLKSGVIANINLDTSIPLIISNSNSLKQILTNLFKNATEAMPDGGEINVSTRDQVNFNGEQFIEIRVSDSGPGMPKEVLNHLFSPVKSTKSSEHSGLGLSIIKNLVNDLGGTIGGSNRYSMQHPNDSVSQENRGAEFIILLPRALIS